METSIYFDWSKNYDENGTEKYENVGRRELENKCTHKNGVEYSGYCDKCGISEDSATPIYNYLYPLKRTDYREDLILKVVENTNLTIVRDNETDEMFLTLCGCGMNLTQDIALAYFILSGDSKYFKIPVDILKDMCLQPALSVSLNDFVKITKAGKHDIKHEIAELQFKLKEFKDANKKAREMLKARRKVTP